jgi:hypothetical protein
VMELPEIIQRYVAVLSLLPKLQRCEFGYWNSYKGDTTSFKTDVDLYYICLTSEERRELMLWMRQKRESLRKANEVPEWLKHRSDT